MKILHWQSLLIVELTFSGVSTFLFPVFQASAQCGWLDPTCRPDQWTRPPITIPKPKPNTPSTVGCPGCDTTPPQVRTARNLINQGYKCVDIKEYKLFTCRVPSSMDSREFSYRSEAFWGIYLGSNRGWAWDCLNRNGQVWGKSNGDLLCQPDMR
jgi:hypothetical protein